MPHEKGFKTSFVVAAQLIDKVCQRQHRIEKLFDVRLHFVETSASHTDRWIEVYNAESQDICAKVTAYVKAMCTPEVESVHRCSAETHRSIFEEGQQDVLEREYAIIIEKLDSPPCTLRARGNDMNVALALSAIDNHVSSRGEFTVPTYTRGLPPASDDAMRLQNLQKHRGDSGSLTSGSESPTLQPHQPPSVEPKNGVRSRLAANLSSSGLRGEVEADDGAEMKILPPSRPNPTRPRAANVSGSEQGRAGVAPTESRAEVVSALTREDAAVGGASYGSSGSNGRPGATISGSSGHVSASVRLPSTDRSSTAGGDRVLPLSDLSDQRPDDSASLVNAAIVAGCDPVSIALVLSESEHNQSDRRWTPGEFIRAVQENQKQQMHQDPYRAASTAADRNAVAASGLTSSAGASFTLAEAARRLPTVVPRRNAAVAGYDTAPLDARLTTGAAPAAAAAASYVGNIMQPVPASRWDAGGSRSSNSGPLVGSDSAVHGSRHATYLPVRSPAVGSQQVAEKAVFGDHPRHEKLSSGSQVPLLVPSEFSVPGAQPEKMQPPQLPPFSTVVGSSAGAATMDPAPLPPQRRHMPSPALAAHQSQAALSESKSSPAILSPIEGKASGCNTEAISFAIDNGYDPAIVYEVDALLGSTVRIADFMQALRSRVDSTFRAGSPLTNVATAQMTKSRSAAPPVSKKGTDVIAFAKDCGYSEDDINAAKHDIGDVSHQEFLAALKRRSETSKAAAGSPATDPVLRPQRSTDVACLPVSSSRPFKIGVWGDEPEHFGGGDRGSPFKQGKVDGAAAAAPPGGTAAPPRGTAAPPRGAAPPPPVGGRKIVGSASKQSTITSATRDQAPASSAQSSNRRRIVIDGSNVAMFKSDGIFRCRNIQICVDYFLKKGHTDITVVVPQHRRWDQATADAYILEDLQKKNLLVYQPSKKLPNMPSIRPYDDKLILDIAANYDGVVISNDNYKDLLNDTPKRDFIIRNRVIMFTIVGDDMFYINDDPMGKGGPTLDELLTTT